MFIVAFTFILCAVIILGVYWMFVVRPEDGAARALRRRLTVSAPEDRPAETDLTKKNAPLSALKALDAVLVGSGTLLDPFKRSVADSGLRVTVGVVLLACGFAASAAFATLVTLTSSFGLSALMAVVAGMLPYAAVRFAATRRLRK